ncbi:MAG: hypothetical protein KJ709_02725 [Nanoarchaeota archaeon]|nr:hypothetical protein [Nanoarchaeota archaeon]
MNQKQVEEECRKLVLARFRSLNPDSKLLLGKGKEMTVRELIGHVEKPDEFGKNVIKVQMRMLKVLTGV